MTPTTLLLLVGVSSSAALGERPPGAVASVEWRGPTGLLRAAVDSTPKTTGGWTVRTAGQVALGRGLEVGAEGIVRDGGPYRKTTLWARLGWRRGAIGILWRQQVAGPAPAPYGPLVSLTALRGRLAVQVEQGLLSYAQPDRRLGYYGTASVGVALGGQRPPRSRFGS